MKKILLLFLIFVHCSNSHAMNPNEGFSEEMNTVPQPMAFDSGEYRPEDSFVPCDCSPQFFQDSPVPIEGGSLRELLPDLFEGFDPLPQTEQASNDLLAQSPQPNEPNSTVETQGTVQQDPTLFAPTRQAAPIDDGFMTYSQAQKGAARSRRKLSDTLCHYCGLNFCSLAALKMHTITHTALTCPYCGCIFAQQSTLTEHLISTHMQNGTVPQPIAIDQGIAQQDHTPLRKTHRRRLRSIPEVKRGEPREIKPVECQDDATRHAFQVACAIVNFIREHGRRVRPRIQQCPQELPTEIMNTEAPQSSSTAEIIAPSAVQFDPNEYSDQEAQDLQFSNESESTLETQETQSQLFNQICEDNDLIPQYSHDEPSSDEFINSAPDTSESDSTLENPIIPSFQDLTQLCEASPKPQEAEADSSMADIQSQQSDTEQPRKLPGKQPRIQYQEEFSQDSESSSDDSSSENPITPLHQDPAQSCEASPKLQEADISTIGAEAQVNQAEPEQSEYVPSESDSTPETQLITDYQTQLHEASPKPQEAEISTIGLDTQAQQAEPEQPRKRLKIQCHAESPQAPEISEDDSSSENPVTPHQDPAQLGDNSPKLQEAETDSDTAWTPGQQDEPEQTRLLTSKRSRRQPKIQYHAESPRGPEISEDDSTSENPVTPPPQDPAQLGDNSPKLQEAETDSDTAWTPGQQDEPEPPSKRPKIQGRNFDKPPAIKKQMPRVAGKQSFTCDECGHVFSRKFDLGRHMMSHAGEKPYICECGNAFSRESDLGRHMRIHLGKKSYKCEECGLCFTQQPHLDSHMTVHTKEKRFTCEECGAKFSQSSARNRHKKETHGKKPFHCEQCSFTCARGSYLNTHMKLVHSKSRK